MKNILRIIKYCAFILLLSASLSLKIASAETLSQRIYMDSPKTSSKLILGKDLEVSGWALNASGVKQVNIYLNNKKIGTAEYGLERSDVNKTYPGYPAEKYNGYRFLIPGNLLVSGNYIITAEAVGNDNSILTTSSIVISKTLGNNLYIDTPEANANINNLDVTVSGWALNSIGTKQINIYLNGKYLGNAQYGSERSDVNRAYPGYPSENNSGYTYFIKGNQFIQGTNIITVESIGNDGSKTNLSKSISYKTLPNKMYIDGPASNTVINKDFLVHGWALNPSGINSINVYVDNKLIGKATTGLERNDVIKAYPGYAQGSKNGYSFAVDIDTIPPGLRTIKVEVVGKNGTIDTESTTLTVEKKPPNAYIDTPDMTINNKDIIVSGWALNDSGIAKVEVYLDNTLLGTAKYGSVRSDVNKTYPNYPQGDNNGYEYVIPMNKMTIGSHTVSVKAVGVDGSYINVNKVFKFTQLVSKLQIDTPDLNITYNPKDILVSGWALHITKIQDIKIYLNGNYIGNSTLGLLRGDVNRAFPGYPQGNNSGYEYRISRNLLVNGNNKIDIEMIGVDGLKVKESTTIKVSIPAPRVYIDSPKGTIDNTDISIVGWAANNSDITKVELYLDGNYINTATKVIRTDVDRAYPHFTTDSKKGFTYTISIDSVLPGDHSLEAVAIGKDGSKTSLSTTFTLVKPLTKVIYKQYPLFFNTAVTRLLSSSKIWSASANDYVPATIGQVEYYLEPSNFYNNSTYKYMFMKLTYSEGITAANLNKILKGRGVLDGKGEVFLQAGKTHNVNPIYLVSHALLETGNGTSRLATGVTVYEWYERVYNSITKTYETVYKKDVDTKKVYNVYGLGAYDDNATLWGSQNAYTQDWTTVDKAIIGGARSIANGYISAGQDTLYKMKWDLNNFWHNYATDIAWPMKQTSRIKQLVDLMDKPSLVFEIPVFLN